jgi:hypothetical protein
MAKQIILGIDPGMGGALAIYDGYTNKYIAYNCPDTISKMVELIEEWSKKASKTICYLERVHAFPTDARSSAFKFGMNYGIWQGILESFEIKTVLVTPQKWQKHFGDMPKDKQERKRQLKMIASDKSGLKTTLKTADAILICEYGKNIENGNN